MIRMEMSEEDRPEPPAGNARSLHILPASRARIDQEELVAGEDGGAGLRPLLRGQGRAGAAKEALRPSPSNRSSVDALTAFASAPSNSRSCTAGRRTAPALAKTTPAATASTFKSVFIESLRLKAPALRSHRPSSMARNSLGAALRVLEQVQARRNQRGDVGRNLIDRARRIDDCAPFGAIASDPQKRLTNAVLIGGALGLEAMISASGMRASDGRRNRRVENEASVAAHRRRRRGSQARRSRARRAPRRSPDRPCSNPRSGPRERPRRASAQD